MSLQVRGSIPEIIRNDAHLYKGDLCYYYRVTWHHAKNLKNTYHGFGHVFHVFYRCYEACLFYQEKISPEEMRILLLAAMFHDFDHPGVGGHDDLNIIRAVRGFRKHVLQGDQPIVERVVSLIDITEYPYKFDTSDLTLLAQILRDADMMQSLGPVWIQPVIFGLAGEWDASPLEILKSQPSFIKNLKLYTAWGQELFPQSEIDAKIAEAQEHNELVF